MPTQREGHSQRHVRFALPEEPRPGFFSRVFGGERRPARVGARSRRELDRVIQRKLRRAQAQQVRQKQQYVADRAEYMSRGFVHFPPYELYLELLARGDRRVDKYEALKNYYADRVRRGLPVLADSR